MALGKRSAQARMAEKPEDGGPKAKTARAWFTTAGPEGRPKHQLLKSPKGHINVQKQGQGAVLGSL